MGVFVAVKIRTKLIISFLIVSLVPLILSGMVISFYEEKGDTKDYINHLKSVATIQHARILGVYQQNVERVNLVASRTQLRVNLKEYIDNGNSSHQDKMNKILLDAKKSINEFKDIYVYDLKGTIVASTDKQAIGISRPDNKSFRSVIENKRNSLFSRDSNENLIIHLSKYLSLNNKVIGVVVVDSKTGNLQSSIDDYTGLGETGETMLAIKNEQGDAAFVMPLRFHKKAVLNLVVPKENKTSPINHAISGEEKIFYDLLDYRQVPVLSVTRYIKEAGWAIVVKIDKKEVLSKSIYNRRVLMIIIVITSMVVILISIFISKIMIAPILKLTRYSQKITEGNLTIKADESSGDETGVLGHAFNVMTESLRKANADLQMKIEESQKTRVLLVNILNSTPDLIFVKNKELHLILTNKHYDKFNQHSKYFDQYDGDVLLGKDIKLSHEISYENNEHYIFETRKIPLRNTGGEIIGVLGMAHDVTEQRSSNEKIEQQKAMLHRSEKMSALGKLTGGIAHDYNNMLGIILGYSEMLQEKLGDDVRLLKYANEINHAGMRGSKLTKKLLGFVRRKNIDAEEVNINDLLNEEQDMLKKTMTVRIELIYELDENLWSVWLDESDLEDTILNMSINAMHAIDGSGRFVIRTENMMLDSSHAQGLGLKTGDYILLSLKDTGCGMTEETQEKIFDPFFSEKGEMGTGLGLSQVYSFVERSKGAISVESKPDEGACFKLYFPRYDNQHDTYIEKTSTEVNSLGGNETILVVDDEKSLLNLNCEILKEKGYNIICAENADQALLLLEKHSVDLLFSDIIMQGMDGYQLASIVKEKYPEIKIQLASGFSGVRNKEKVDQALQANILKKPYNAQQLFKKIRDLLDKKQDIKIVN